MTALELAPAPFRIVALEGIDAAGKTTLASGLVARLADLRPASRIVAAGEFGSPIGNLLRHSIGTLTWLEKVHWFAADRASVFERLRCDPEWIDREKGLVVWDRYIYSALAYRLAEARMSGMNETDALRIVRAVNSAFPEALVTVYLDVPVSTSRSRRPTEHQSEAKLAQVALAYSDIFDGTPGVIRVDSTDEPGVVLDKVVAALKEHGLLTPGEGI